MVNFLIILLFETAQNAPFAILGIVGLFWWHRGETWPALITLALGSLGSSWLIVRTDSHKVKRTTSVESGEPRSLGERLREVLGNAMLFFVGFLLFYVYLNQAWSNLLSDLLIVFVLGAGVAIGEEFTAKEKSTKTRLIAHILAFVVTGMALLPVLRFVMQVHTLSLAIALGVLFCLVMSVLITAIDYLPFLKLSESREDNKRALLERQKELL